MAKTRDHPVQAFVKEVTATLLVGRPHRTPGLGTFSICTRRGTPDRCASTMALFRASTELRAYASGGPLPTLSGRHAPAVRTIVRGMLRKEGITIPQLGRMAVVPVSGSSPKLIFHGARKLDRKSTRLNSSHTVISYAVFCLKKKNHGLDEGSGAKARSKGQTYCAFVSPGTLQYDDPRK